MEKRSIAGYTEVAHTADWAIKVWALDYPCLLKEAAKGMYFLMGLHLVDSPRRSKSFVLQEEDVESLIVAFLSELLYFCEQEDLGFNHFDLIVQGSNLTAKLEGAKIANQYKEIKAVTFHNLVIHRTESGFETMIVFDV